MQKWIVPMFNFILSVTLGYRWFNVLISKKKTPFPLVNWLMAIIIMWVTLTLLIQKVIYDNRDFDSFFEKVVKINGAKIYHNTSLLPHNHRGNTYTLS